MRGHPIIPENCAEMITYIQGEGAWGGVSGCGGLLKTSCRSTVALCTIHCCCFCPLAWVGALIN